MQTQANYLRKVKALIADPKHWTKEAFARDAKGNPAPTLSEEATCFCLWGAIIRASDNTVYGDQLASDAYSSVERCVRTNSTGFREIPTFNDAATTTHADVMRVLDCAIEKASNQ